MSAGAVAGARDFVDAVAWGDHTGVWDLLTDDARTRVLEVARRRGMADSLVSAIATGTADSADSARFLVDLVNGLRADLGDTDLDGVDFEDGAVVPVPDRPTDDDVNASPDRTYVTVVDPPPAALVERGAESLPTAVLELERDPGGWRVVRVVPVRSG